MFVCSISWFPSSLPVVSRNFPVPIPRLAGKLRAARERMGRPISLSDGMIAAICLAHDATLATRNVRDFDGLDLKSS